MTCGETVRGGVAGLEYRRYCRLEAPHPGVRHQDGDFKWGEGSAAAPTPKPLEDAGQGDGCEGGKCQL